MYGAIHALQVQSKYCRCASVHTMSAQDDAATAPPGPLYLPDAAGVLAPATALFFNDAPWLEDTGARLVHSTVSNDVAEALHVQSLRFHHEVCCLYHDPLDGHHSVVCLSYSAKSEQKGSLCASCELLSQQEWSDLATHHVLTARVMRLTQPSLCMGPCGPNEQSRLRSQNKHHVSCRTVCCR